MAYRILAMFNVKMYLFYLAFVMVSVNVFAAENLYPCGAWKSTNGETEVSESLLLQAIRDEVSEKPFILKQTDKQLTINDRLGLATVLTPLERYDDIWRWYTHKYQRDNGIVYQNYFLVSETKESIEIHTVEVFSAYEYNTKCFK